MNSIRRPRERLKIAVIGASGFLGSKLMSVLSHSYGVVGTYHERARPDLMPLNIANSTATLRFFRTQRPDITIHCGGITRPDGCEAYPQVARAVNVEGMRNILTSTGSKILFFSTDYVFDGTVGSYSEEDTPGPVNVYGMTKLMAEEDVLNASPNNVVLRVATLYGANPACNTFVEGLHNLRPAQRAVDLICSPTLLDDVVEHLPSFFDRGGLYHLVGPDRVSRYEFFRRAVQVMGAGDEPTPLRSEEIRSIAPRPRDTSLRTKRLTLPMHGIEEGLAIVKSQLKSSSQ